MISMFTCHDIIKIHFINYFGLEVGAYSTLSYMMVYYELHSSGNSANVNPRTLWTTVGEPCSQAMLDVGNYYF